MLPFIPVHKTFIQFIFICGEVMPTMKGMNRYFINIKLEEYAIIFIITELLEMEENKTNHQCSQDTYFKQSKITYILSISTQQRLFNW